MGITAVLAAGDTWENATIVENAGADERALFSQHSSTKLLPQTMKSQALSKALKNIL